MKNQSEQDVEDLKAAIDETIIQTALNSAQIGVLQSMILGVCGETLPDEAYKNLCTNYLFELKRKTDEAFERLDGVLFEPGARALKLKVDAHFHIEKLKRDLGVPD